MKEEVNGRVLSDSEGGGERLGCPSGTFAAHRDTQMRQRTRTRGNRDAMTGRFEDMAGVAKMEMQIMP